MIEKKFAFQGLSFKDDGIADKIDFSLESIIIKMYPADKLILLDQRNRSL